MKKILKVSAFSLLMIPCLVLAQNNQSQMSDEASRYLDERIKKIKDLDNARIDAAIAQEEAAKEKSKSETAIEKSKRGVDVSSSSDIDEGESTESRVAHSPMPRFKRVVGQAFMFDYNGGEVGIRLGDFIGGYQLVTAKKNFVTLEKDGTRFNQNLRR